MEDVIQNVMETSAWEDEGYYNDDDIRLAIGRELMARARWKEAVLQDMQDIQNDYDIER